ncbi:MAG: hypothetical protein WD048_07140 [Chitinophagales bacterium]
MENIAYKSEIENTFSTVRNFSYEEKKSQLLDEERMNAFLDAILDFKSILKDKTDRLNLICDKIEKITWFDNVDEESLMLLNDLISSAKDLRSSLIRQYVLMGKLRKNGIAKEEIKAFKNAIDELKESYEDIESVFFFLPKMPDFTDTTKKLSLIK